MLQSLSIRNVVLIDTLDVSFEAGLCALTGETGAGKSILLGALGLALGERAERTLVSHGADEARSTGEFNLDANHPARALLVEAEIDVDPDEPIILRRKLGVDGRSRAFINDQPASIGLLRQLGRYLVEVHGQHDGRGLMDPKTHRGQLDEFAGNTKLIKTCGLAWKGVSEAIAHLEQLEKAHQDSTAEQEYLRHALEELDGLSPEIGEDEALAHERQFLMGAEKAITELQDAQQAFTGEGAGLEDRLNASLSSLERVRDQIGSSAGKAGEALERAVKAIDRALIEFGEAGDALSEAGRAFDVEPGRLSVVEERLFALRALARKHEVSAEALPDLRQTLADRLDAIDHADERIDEAKRSVQALQAVYDDASVALTRSRTKAGLAISKTVEAELPPLKMEKAKFRVSIITDANKAGPNGCDTVRFEVSTNPGAPFDALDKIASGGELARFALALKVSLATENHGKVLVFDEVDQGVGGAVADAVGARLHALARKGQTLVVTHSPQVAARADHHFRIEKLDDGQGGVRTTLVHLTGDARREEIARMLSGAQITDAARSQADVLMGVGA